MTGYLFPKITQLLVVSRTHSEIRLTFTGTTLAPQRDMTIVVVTDDSNTTFKAHNTHLATTAAGQFASLSRITWLLVDKGSEMLYIQGPDQLFARVLLPPASSHVATVDKVEVRAARIVWDDHREYQSSVNNLQHHRDVMGLTTLDKEQQAAHLQPVRQPAQRVEGTPESLMRRV